MAQLSWPTCKPGWGDFWRHISHRAAGIPAQSATKNVRVRFPRTGALLTSFPGLASPSREPVSAGREPREDIVALSGEEPKLESFTTRLTGSYFQYLLKV
jgi:hypothetical protein